jgi:hypothetical protein
MKSFYSQGIRAPGDDSYTKDLQDSLDRLEDKEEIINEWKSYCDTLASSWETRIRQYWTTAFFRVFQDQLINEIFLWLSSGKLSLIPVLLSWL